MKKALFSRLLTIALILGLLSAAITPQNVNAATITPQSLFAANEIVRDESAANSSTKAWVNSDTLLDPPPPIIQSISGSQITLDTTLGHPGAYVPGVPTTLYFKSDVYTDDYEWLEDTWLKFPTTWTITDVTVVGTPTCTSGGAWGNFQLLWENQPYELKIQHSAIMETTDHCTSTYAIQLTPGAATGPALVSWYFAGDTGPLPPNGAKKPHYVCSDDGYTPGSMALLKLDCEESVNPRVSIPSALPPVAVSQSVTTDEDTTKQITLAASNPNGGTLTYAIVDQPINGAVVLAANVATYTPHANYNGPDSFTFKAYDGLVYSNTATVSITVTPVPDAPIAQNQAVSTVEDTARVINLLATDADGDPLTYSIVTFPTKGAVVLAGSVATYTPNANYTGPDSFTFQATDVTLLVSNPATISITVNPVNDPPVAQDQSVTTNEDIPVAITLIATDIDSTLLTYSVVTPPTNGVVVIALNVATYTPFPNYNGPDSFTFKANDGAKDSNFATVTITVNPVNDAPVAQDQTVTTNEDVPVAITLVATDVDSPSLTYNVLGGPSNGTLSGTAPNLIYTPTLNYNGTDSFTFMANDGTANGNTATVSINVTPVNDAPVAQAQALSVLRNTSTAITLVATDVDGDPLTYTIILGPTNGALSGTAPDLTYTPNTDYLGSDSFTFKANDGTVDSNTATITIDVKTNNIAPVAYDQNNVSTLEDTPVEITLIATDADILDSLTFSVVQPTNGAVVLVGNKATYTPAPNFFGTDSFTFTATDGIAVSNVATVSITVTAVNDTPTDLALSNTIVAENTAIGTLVGTFTTTDPDTGDTFIYEFASGGADNAAFTINGDQLLTAASIDFEAKSSYSIWIRTTDQGNLFFEKNFIITVTDLNEAPTNLALSYSSVAENMPINTVVGTLSTTDQDLASTFIYTFASGGTDNAAFTINGDQLLTAASFDFETKNSYSIKIRTTDQGNLFFEKPFIISVTNVNEAPVVSDIPNQTIAEGQSFTTINLDTFVNDPDNTAAEMTWTYTGNTDLTVSILNQVATITIPNVNWNGTETITFRATDPGFLWGEDSATFNVTPVNDAPVSQEGFVSTTKDVPVAITLLATDVDGDVLTYTVVVQPRFGTLSGTAPNLTYTPNAGYVGTDNFSFIASDLGLLSNPAMVTITVNETSRFIYLPIIFK